MKLNLRILSRLGLRILNWGRPVTQQLNEPEPLSGIEAGEIYGDGSLV